MDKLEDKLKSIQNKLGGTKPTPEVIDKLGWHLDYIEQLIEGGGSGGEIPEPTVEDAGKALLVNELGKYELGEIQAGGGTKLYKHSLEKGSTKIYLINTDADAYDLSSLSGYSFIGKITNSIVVKISNNTSGTQTISQVNPSSNSITFYYVSVKDAGGNLMVSGKSLILDNTFTDTVTEL